MNGLTAHHSTGSGRTVNHLLNGILNRLIYFNALLKSLERGYNPSRSGITDENTSAERM
jgi:hypothetical protein